MLICPISVYQIDVLQRTYCAISIHSGAMFISVFPPTTEEHIDFLSSPAICENVNLIAQCYKGEECQFLRTELPTKASGQLPVILLPANKLMSLIPDTSVNHLIFMIGHTYLCMLSPIWKS